MAFSTETKETVRRIAKASTRALAEESYGEPASGDRAQMAKIRSLIEIIEGIDLNPERHNRLKRICAILMDVDEGLFVTHSKITHKAWSVVVPLEHIGSHDYALGVPCMIYYLSGTGSACAIKRDGNTGNSLPPDKNCFRPATEAEIDLFIDTLFSRDLEAQASVAIKALESTINALSSPPKAEAAVSGPAVRKIELD